MSEIKKFLKENVLPRHMHSLSAGAIVFLGFIIASLLIFAVRFFCESSFTAHNILTGIFIAIAVILICVDVAKERD